MRESGIRVDLMGDIAPHVRSLMRTAFSYFLLSS
jgi:hypothetical protein